MRTTPNSEAPSLEITREANRRQPGAVIVLVVDKKKIQAARFAEKSGAALVMDRQAFSTNLMLFIIRLLRQRTFRTVLRSDLPLGQTLPVDLYHYLPLNRRYAVVLRAGQTYTEEWATKLKASHVRHLYVREADLDSLLQTLRNMEERFLARCDGQMSVLRGHRRWIISLFDCSSDGNTEIGRELWRDGIAIVRGFEKLIDTYRNSRECLAELPYPRWSGIAHGMNTVIYALIFGETCGIPHREETAIAALIHNLGEAALNQDMLQVESREFSSSEAAEYRTHVNRAAELIERKVLVRAAGGDQMRFFIIMRITMAPVTPIVCMAIRSPCLPGCSRSSTLTIITSRRDRGNPRSALSRRGRISRNGKIGRCGFIRS